MANDKNGRNKLVKTLVTIILVIIAAVFGIDVTNIIPNENSKEDILELTMIEVGQADSFLLIQGEDVALVDCGTRSTGDDVVEHLKSIGITEIDYLIGTHPHDDHMGGMYDVITNFEIGKIIMPEIKGVEITTTWYTKLENEIKNGDYDREYAEVGTVYNLGDANMKIIGPISKPNDNLNSYSIVMKVSFGEMDIIMTGDAEVEVEEEILKSGENIDAEILKVGHHGSKTSTSEEFLDAISPDYALISTKVDNKYDHPDEETMEKLQKRNIKVYRTDENGTVVLTITTDDVSFSCKPGDYLTGPELEERMSK